MRRANFDLFFLPAVYSYFPVLARVPCIVCYHDTTAERLPELLFPTKLNHRLWQAKTQLAKLQARRSHDRVAVLRGRPGSHLRIPKDRIDLVTEAADPVFACWTTPPSRRRPGRARRSPRGPTSWSTSAA